MPFTIRISTPAVVLDAGGVEIDDKETLKSLHAYSAAGVLTIGEYLEPEADLLGSLEFLDCDAFPVLEYWDDTEELVLSCVFNSPRELTSQELTELCDVVAELFDGNLGEDFVVHSGLTTGLGISCDDPFSVWVSQTGGG